MKPHVARKLQQYLLDQYYENGTIARLSTQDARRVLVYLQRTEARRRRSVRWLRRLNSCARIGRPRKKLRMVTA